MSRNLNGPTDMLESPVLQVSGPRMIFSAGMMLHPAMNKAQARTRRQSEFSSSLRSTGLDGFRVCPVPTPYRLDVSVLPCSLAVSANLSPSTCPEWGFWAARPCARSWLDARSRSGHRTTALRLPAERFRRSRRDGRTSETDDDEEIPFHD